MWPEHLEGSDVEPEDVVKWISGSRAGEKGLLLGLAIVVWRAIAAWIGVGPEKRDRPQWVRFTMWLLAFGALVVMASVLAACAIASGANSQAWGVKIDDTPLNIDRRIGGGDVRMAEPAASAASSP